MTINDKILEIEDKISLYISIYNNVPAYLIEELITACDIRDKELEKNGEESNTNEA